MAARGGRAVGLLVMAAILAVGGCEGDSRTAVGVSSEQAADVKEVARDYQQASVDQDYEAACEARTKRLLRSWDADTIAECVEITSAPRIGDYRDARVSTGEPIKLPAFGPHSSGIGLRVTVRSTLGGLVKHTALRLVPGERDSWLVDQMANLVDETDTGAVQAALEGRL